jgi:hypothetical protein
MVPTIVYVFVASTFYTMIISVGLSIGHLQLVNSFLHDFYLFLCLGPSLAAGASSGGMPGHSQVLMHDSVFSQ